MKRRPVCSKGSRLARLARRYREVNARLGLLRIWRDSDMDQAREWRAQMRRAKSLGLSGWELLAQDIARNVSYARLWNREVMKIKRTLRRGATLQ